MSATIAESKREVDALQESNAELKSLSSDQQQKLDEARASYEELEKDNSSIVRNLKAEIIAMKENINDLVAKNQFSFSELQVAQEVNSSLQAVVDEHSHLIGVLTSENNKYLSDLKCLEESHILSLGQKDLHLVELQKEISEKQNAIKSLWSTRDSLSLNIKCMAEKEHSLDNQISLLKSESAKLRESNRILSDLKCQSEIRLEKIILQHQSELGQKDELIQDLREKNECLDIDNSSSKLSTDFDEQPLENDSNLIRDDMLMEKLKDIRIRIAQELDNETVFIDSKIGNKESIAEMSLATAMTEKDKHIIRLEGIISDKQKILERLTIEQSEMIEKEHALSTELFDMKVQLEATLSEKELVNEKLKIESNSSKEASHKLSSYEASLKSKEKEIEELHTQIRILNQKLEHTEKEEYRLRKELLALIEEKTEPNQARSITAQLTLDAMDPSEVSTRTSRSQVIVLPNEESLTVRSLSPAKMKILRSVATLFGFILLVACEYGRYKKAMDLATPYLGIKSTESCALISPIDVNEVDTTQTVISTARVVSTSFTSIGLMR